MAGTEWPASRPTAQSGRNISQSVLLYSFLYQLCSIWWEKSTSNVIQYMQFFPFLCPWKVLPSFPSVAGHSKARAIITYSLAKHKGKPARKQFHSYLGLYTKSLISLVKIIISFCVFSRFPPPGHGPAYPIRRSSRLPGGRVSCSSFFTKGKYILLSCK